MRWSQHRNITTSHSSHWKIDFRIIHWNEQHEFEKSAVHALMEYKGSVGELPPIYGARKYVVASPISNARRVALPLIAMCFNGDYRRSSRRCTMSWRVSLAMRRVVCILTRSVCLYPSYGYFVSLSLRWAMCKNEWNNQKRRTLLH